MLKLKNYSGPFFVWCATAISGLVIFTILAVLAITSWPSIVETGFGFFDTVWNPVDGEFGILPMLYGTLAVTLTALVIAVPMGFFTGVYLSEIVKPSTRIYLKTALEILAGIPSIIYGLIGVSFLAPFLSESLNLQTGRTLLAAGILLGIMVLPTLITLVDDALRNVPNRYREAARGLGLFPYEVTLFTVIPLAKNGLTSAVLLALGRALGETMAVMLVIGSIDRLPTPIYNFLVPGQTITSKLGREMAESVFGSIHFSAMVFIGFILLITVLLITYLTGKFSKKIIIHE
ncbi:MAG: phosphate transport system permease protein [Sphingobacteriales bacterium]|jgi:phosphate transport system permease protein